TVLSNDLQPEQLRDGLELQGIAGTTLPDTHRRSAGEYIEHGRGVTRGSEVAITVEVSEYLKSYSELNIRRVKTIKSRGGASQRRCRLKTRQRKHPHRQYGQGTDG